MFWGVTLENDKRYTQTVEASFHLSMAALDPNPPSECDVNKTPTVSLWLQHDKAEFLLCTLEYGKLYQQTLNCNFTEGEEVTFFLNGQGVIHLTGYLVEGLYVPNESGVEPVMASEDEESSDSVDSEDLPVLIDPKDLVKGAKKRTKKMKVSSKKKCKVEDEMEDSDDTSDDDDDDYSDSDEDEDYSDFKGKDESSEDDLSDDSDENDSKKNSKKKRLKVKLRKEKNSSSLKQTQTGSAKDQKMSKKLKKQMKALSDSMLSAEDKECVEKALLDASVLSEKKKKKKKMIKTSESSNSSALNNKQESSTPSEDHKSKSRVLSSGLVIEDIQVGEGAEARVGRQVHVYYSGKFAKSGKTFDRCISGKPFKFALGRGEVITGWERGLVGMRVGGKRKLSIPAKLGYGNQQVGIIPPNSSLIFDVELKAVS